MNYPKTIVHIGMPGTATSSLQRNVFGRHKDLFSVGKPYRDEEWSKLMQNLINADDYDLEHVRLAQRFSEASKIAANEEKTLILSEELISSSPMQSVAAQRIKKYLPTSEILITIRNQYTAVISYYSNHGTSLKYVPGRWNGRHVSFDEWFEFSANNILSLTFPLNLGFFRRIRYFHFADIYTKLFGPNRVHILLYEDLVHDTEKFATQLVDILKIDPKETLKLLQEKRENPRDSGRRHQYHKLRSIFLPDVRFSKLMLGGAALRRRIDEYLDKGAGYVRDLKGEERAVIRGLFSEDNARLAERFCLDLAKYGYPLP